MSYYNPPTTKKPAKPRRCGFTRPELSQLRVLSTRRRPHNVRSWLHEQASDDAILGNAWLRHRFEAALRRTTSGWVKAQSPEPKKPKGAKKNPIAFRSINVCSSWVNPLAHPACPRRRAY